MSTHAGDYENCYDCDNCVGVSGPNKSLPTKVTCDIFGFVCLRTSGECGEFIPCGGETKIEPVNGR